MLECMRLSFSETHYKLHHTNGKHLKTCVCVDAYCVCRVKLRIIYVSQHSCDMEVNLAID